VPGLQQDGFVVAQVTCSCPRRNLPSFAFFRHHHGSKNIETSARAADSGANLKANRFIEDHIRDEIWDIVENERYTKAFWDTTVETDRPYREDTARFEAFGQEPVDIDMSELFGCTTLMVVSRRGAYVAHWWEHQDFENRNRLTVTIFTLLCAATINLFLIGSSRAVTRLPSTRGLLFLCLSLSCLFK
jgi:hypothetical protein